MTVLRALASVPHELMSDKSGKAKKAKKSSAAQPSVLGSLPATRPDRLSRRGGATATKPAPARTARTTTAAKPAAPKRAKPKATRSTAASRAATAEKAAAAQRRSARPAPPPPPPQDEPRRVSGPPKGPELVTTAFQAAGEIAHIGITVGGQVLKRAARRIPRP
jgi:hypothetical protein